MSIFVKSHNDRRNAMQYIFRRNVDPRALTKEQFDRMSKENTRGMTDDDTSKENLRLTNIEKGLGYKLPENIRIQKSIYGYGSNRQGYLNPVVPPTINISAPTTSASTKYQFLIEIAKKQVAEGYVCEVVIIVDMDNNVYDLQQVPALIAKLDITETQLKSFIKSIVIKNRYIIMYHPKPYSQDELKFFDIEKIATEIEEFSKIDFTGDQSTYIKELDQKVTKSSEDIEKISKTIEGIPLEIKNQLDVILSLSEKLIENSKKTSKQEKKDAKIKLNELEEEILKKIKMKTDPKTTINQLKKFIAISISKISEEKDRDLILKKINSSIETIEDTINKTQKAVEIGVYNDWKDKEPMGLGTDSKIGTKLNSYLTNYTAKMANIINANPIAENELNALNISMKKNALNFTSIKSRANRFKSFVSKFTSNLDNIKTIGDISYNTAILIGLKASDQTDAEKYIDSLINSFKKTK